MFLFIRWEICKWSNYGGYCLFHIHVGALVAIDEAKDRILGGAGAYISEFPYQVSLRMTRTNHHFCGGSIISERHILTAAHCVVGMIRPPYSDVRVYTGSSNSKNPYGPSHWIRRVDVHPWYAGRAEMAYHNDVAVITVSEVVINWRKILRESLICFHCLVHG